MEILPVTRKERFLKAAMDSEPLTIDAVTRIETYLSKISGADVTIPDPVTKIEMYLASIAGADVVLPDPVTKVEKYLAKLAGMDVIVPEPITRIEQFLSDWVNQPAGVLKTISGAVVFVSDALARAAEDISVEINPIQDLHGYDNPWPAGGGKNKVDITKHYTNGWTNSANSITAIYNNGVFTISGTSDSSSWTNIVNDQFAFQNDGFVIPAGTYTTPAHCTFVVNIAGTNTNKTGTFSLSESGTVIGFFIPVAPNAATGWSIPLCLVEGSTAPSSYIPYSNECPITGHSEANVTRTGKNLLAKPFTYRPVPSKLSDCFFIKAGTYTFTFDTIGTATSWRFGVSMFDGNGNALSDSAHSPWSGSSYVASVAMWYGGIDTTDKTRTLTYIEDCYTRIWFGSGNTSSGMEATDAMLNVGSTAKPYEPYQGTTYSIDWTSDGTVYGGTLDVTTGVLTVDRAIDTITKDSTWYGFAAGAGNSSAVVQLSNYLNVKYVDGASSFNGAISSTGREAQNYWVSARQNETPNEGDMCFAHSQSGQLRFHRLDVANITDLASFKANFPDTTICYYLATPLTIQLTPTEIEMLEGNNTLWADTGDITVTYMADGNANDVEALNILLGNRYVNLGEPDEATDREALDILLGGR